MKAILEFDLPEDREQFNAASQAQDWVLAMFDLDEWVRGRMKCADLDTNAYYAIKNVRGQICTILEDRNLSLDVLS